MLAGLRTRRGGPGGGSLQAAAPPALPGRLPLLPAPPGPAQAAWRSGGLNARRLVLGGDLMCCGLLCWWLRGSGLPLLSLGLPSLLCSAPADTPGTSSSHSARAQASPSPWLGSGSRREPAGSSPPALPSPQRSQLAAQPASGTRAPGGQRWRRAARPQPPRPRPLRRPRRGQRRRRRVQAPLGPTAARPSRGRCGGGASWRMHETRAPGPPGGRPASPPQRCPPMHAP